MRRVAAALSLFLLLPTPAVEAGTASEPAMTEDYISYGAERKRQSLGFIPGTAISWQNHRYQVTWRSSSNFPPGR